ncbi:hypothetical protein [Tropicimonas sp. IMCC6043]|uniref:hypothetical protein n=1 Tax=Tropicimonas sp. IMCC6043 TaxID=2510645 RepID=UPI00101D1B8E|nr:hypothetical protein [Tropicimonas sp. IMCC6043]RYH06332.1 hypothetical protein EU800_24160 [Tropicimonas sp. IMCC6043]
MTKLLFATALASLSFASAGLADDHLFNGATAAGASERDFGNPVAGNPSGKSGSASDPGTVPGLGNPNAGGDTGTPSFDPESLAERLEGRTGN